MKKEWKKPYLDILGVESTMAGPGIKIEDEFQPDEDEMVHYS